LRLQAAAKEAEVARASDAQLAAVYDALGRAGMGSGHYRDGKRNFERALRLAADGPLEGRAAVTSNLGQACQALGELVRAEQLFRQALAAMPNRADLWNQLGGVLALQRRYLEAEDALRQALSNPADPASVTARNDLAVIYEARGKLHQAAGLYEQAISSAPAGQSRARILANLGALRLKLGNPAGAVVALGRSLQEMERTGGEPDVVGLDKKTGEYIFYDCSAESPKGRRSVCYDREALESRKEHKPENNAVDMAAAMGIELLTEEQYRELQKLGNFDTKTSSWITTPSEIRKLGGAIFADYRYGNVFVYHNGAESYYAARAFRGSLRV
jgi:Tfp pilus assembly protein PilF